VRRRASDLLWAAATERDAVRRRFGRRAWPLAWPVAKAHSSIRLDLSAARLLRARVFPPVRLPRDTLCRFFRTTPGRARVIDRVRHLRLPSVRSVFINARGRPREARPSIVIRIVHGADVPSTKEVCTYTFDVGGLLHSGRRVHRGNEFRVSNVSFTRRAAAKSRINYKRKRTLAVITKS